MEDEKTPEPTPEPAPQAKWEYRKNFGINERMKDVIGKTIDATESELVVLRRKLDKLQYGS